MIEERRPTILTHDARTVTEEALIVCRCEEISKAEIQAAIAAGCDSVIWVKRKTRAGMGLCQGRTCGRLVARIISEETGQNPADVLPDTQRPPLRPIPLEILVLEQSQDFALERRQDLALEQSQDFEERDEP